MHMKVADYNITAVMDLRQQATDIQHSLGCSPSLSSSSPSLSPDVTNGENMVIPFKASP